MSAINTKLTLKKIYWWIGFILIYVVLFEFLIPNIFFPKPSILVESVSSLQKDYDFFFNLFYSLSGIYFSILLAFLLLNFTYKLWFQFLEKQNNLINFLKGFLFFPLIGLLLVVIYNFPVSVASEYVLWIIVSCIILLRVLDKNLKKIKPEYIEAYQSISISGDGMVYFIRWKLIQPEVFKAIKKLHLFLWSTVIIFEFLKNHFGIGHIYNSAFQYKDYSGIIALSFIVMVVISFGNFVIGFLQQKYFFWEQ